jgi:lysophospholipase L1-like esterase
MSRWLRAKPPLGGADLTHPTPLGAEVIGDMLSDAILDAYGQWSKRRADVAHR